MKYLMLSVAIIISSTALACDDIRWDAPTEREDGSSLNANEVGHYLVHIGRNSGVAERTIETTSIGVTCKEAGINTGTYYIWGQTVDNEGLISGYSSSIMVTVLNISPPKAPRFRRWLNRIRGR